MTELFLHLGAITTCQQEAQMSHFRKEGVQVDDAVAGHSSFYRSLLWERSAFRRGKSLRFLFFSA